MRRVLVRAAKECLRWPADALVSSSQVLPRRIDDCLSESKAVMENAFVSAKFYPDQSESRNLALHDEGEAAETRIPGEPLPYPPEELWEGYGPTLERYRQDGKRHFGNLKRIVEENGFRFEKGKRVLDFGCSAGRLIRYFEPYAGQVEVRGVDISGKHIAWCQRHLSPFHFTTTTTFPHLPFEDRYFDLIYSGSVFTHISDLADAWLLELRRVLRPGGMIYATVHDNHSIDLLRRDWKDFFLTRIVNDYDEATRFLERGFRMVSIRRSPKDAMVFYDQKFLESHWGREMEWVGLFPEAYDYQSAVLLRKPAKT